MSEVFENYNSLLFGHYPDKLSFIPSVWGNSYISFIPDRFAIYNKFTKRFIVYKTSNVIGKFKFETAVTNRPDPYYLKVLDESNKVPDISYKIPFESNEMILSFANAYLCKRSDDELIPVIPIMNSSHYDYLLSLIHESYVGYKIYNNGDVQITNYVQKYNTFNILENLEIKNKAKNIPYDVIINHPQSLFEVIPNITKTVEVKSLPEYVRNLLIENAITKGETCPITMETIEKETATVTSCFHVFEKSSIETWLSNKSNDNKCPVCKQICAI